MISGGEYPPRSLSAGVLDSCLVGAQHAAPYLFITGRLNPYPLLGAAGYRQEQDPSFRWAHPRSITGYVTSILDKYMSATVYCRVTVFQSISNGGSYEISKV
jgi:hypothetical protein